MARLTNTGPSRMVKGVGYVRAGNTYTVPEDLKAELLASGEWAKPGAATEVVSDPGPSKAKKAKKGAKGKKAKKGAKGKKAEPVPAPAVTGQASQAEESSG